MPDDVLLRTEALTRAFGSLLAVDRVDVTVRRGELRSIIGPNGAGKTTLFRLISGEMAPTSGRIWFDGRELGAGVVDVKGFQEDTAEGVAARIRRVLEVCPAEKLTLNPDCGFGWSPRYMCNQKLHGLAAGAALARRELAGTR